MALTKVPSNLDATIATTQSQADNSTNIATTAYVDLAVSSLSDSAPAALNTLNEIAAALGDDANYASTTTAAIAAKLPLSGGTMTGNLTVNAIVDADNFKINGGQGSDGQVLTSTGSGIAWEAIPASISLSGSTNNTLVTVTGANAMLGESSLTYDGLHLGMTSNHTGHPSDVNVLQLGGNAVIQGKTATGAGKSFRIMQNVYDDISAGLSYISTDEASHYTQVNGTHSFNVAASGTADAAITFVEAMKIDSAGNVGIGTAAPAKPLHLKVSSGWATMRLEGAGDSGGELEFYATSTKKGSIWFGNDGGFNVRVNGADDTIKINSSRVMAFGGANPLGTNSGTIQAGGDVMATDSFGTLGTHLQIVYTAGTDQELRILRSNGNRVATFTESETFLLGKTASSTTTAGFQASTNDFMCYTNTSTDTGDRLLILNQQNRSSGDLLQFRTQGSNVGIISLNSSGNMVYGGQSDYRLKENVNYTWSATAKLKQLKPCEFEWKSNNYDAVNQGFLAHEVAAVVPQAVVGNKDGVDKDDNPSYQQLDNSALVPLLTKAIQEQQTLIESLTARITTLEG